MKEILLKILMISTSFPTNWNETDGILFREMARSFSNKHEITILHCCILPNDSKVNPGIYEETLEKIKIIRVYIKKPILPHMIAYTLGFIKGLRYLRKQNIEFDIVHGLWFQSIIPFIFIWKNIPVVLTEGWSGFSLGQLNFITKLLARKTMSHCKTVMPTSNYLISKIKSYGVKTNFIPIPSIVDTSFFYPIEKNSNDTTKLLIVARQDPVKGIPILLKAIQKISENEKKFHLDIVGGGSYLKEYKQLSKHLHVENHVTFHGEKTKGEVAKFMQSCDFFILSSITEGLSGVISEAMCCGKPTVATNVGAIPELFDMVKIPLGKLVEYDPDAIADGIKFMLENFKTFDSFHLASRGKELFSAESWLEKYEKIYFDAINN